MTLREARPQDLSCLLALYTHLHGNPLPEDGPALQALWQDILSDPHHHILLAWEGAQAVSTCVVLLVPNLTHSQRPYALVENVVTHPDFRGRGYGTAVLDAARDLARQAGCYKIMLLTGSKRPETLAFYRRAGFQDGDKTGFVQWLP